MNTLKRTKSVIAHFTIPMLLGGCNLLSPIKGLDCIYTTTSPHQIDKEGKTTSRIINNRTGNNYILDELSEKLVSVLGETEYSGWKIKTRSLIVGDELRFVQTRTDPNNIMHKFAPEELVLTINLKTMMFEEELKGWIGELGQGNYKGKGTCKWVKPKTTEILQEPKT